MAGGPVIPPLQHGTLSSNLKQGRMQLHRSRGGDPCVPSPPSSHGVLWDDVIAATDSEGCEDDADLSQLPSFNLLPTQAMSKLLRQGAAPALPMQGEGQRARSGFSPPHLAGAPRAEPSLGPAGQGIDQDSENFFSSSIRRLPSFNLLTAASSALQPCQPPGVAHPSPWGAGSVPHAQVRGVASLQDSAQGEPESMRGKVGGERDGNLCCPLNGSRVSRLLKRSAAPPSGSAGKDGVGAITALPRGRAQAADSMLDFDEDEEENVPTFDLLATLPTREEGGAAGTTHGSSRLLSSILEQRHSRDLAGRPAAAAGLQDSAQNRRSRLSLGVSAASLPLRQGSMTPTLRAAPAVTAGSLILQSGGSAAAGGGRRIVGELPAAPGLSGMTARRAAMQSLAAGSEDRAEKRQNRPVEDVAIVRVVASSSSKAAQQRHVGGASRPLGSAAFPLSIEDEGDRVGGRSSLAGGKVQRGPFFAKDSCAEDAIEDDDDCDDWAHYRPSTSRGPAATGQPAGLPRAAAAGRSGSNKALQGELTPSAEQPQLRHCAGGAGMWPSSDGGGGGTERTTAGHLAALPSRQPQLSNGLLLIPARRSSAGIEPPPGGSAYAGWLRPPPGYESAVSERMPGSFSAQHGNVAPPEFELPRPHAAGAYQEPAPGGDSSGAAAGSSTSANRWWQLLPDFVPVAALASGVDPRNGQRVHILYSQQFTSESVAAHVAAAARDRAGMGVGTYDEPDVSGPLAPGSGAAAGRIRRGAGEASRSQRGGTKRSRSQLQADPEEAGGNGRWYTINGAKVFRDNKSGKLLQGRAAFKAHKGACKKGFRRRR